ncbi:hypothetical protein AB0H83_31135 [Dactylosporangium sp. NPDC050688]|uniref:hypothetical protein n=1 Tax=Dactylosporangium sp. NPDC050688 TaxID=3157217 RepID=UPI0033FB0825
MTTTEQSAVVMYEADQDGAPGTECGSCVTWAVKYTVAMQASYYLTLHIVSPRLRELVLDDLAIGYAAAVAKKEVAEFAEYFESYTDRVERALDPEKLRGGEHIFEYRRVWSNHATLLCERRLRLVRRAEKARRRRT